jgi:hypothetical protein
VTAVLFTAGNAAVMAARVPAENAALRGTAVAA